MLINWHSRDSHILVNPKLKLNLDEKQVLSRHDGHLWLMTSGNSKLVGLSKNAILSSAQTVNNSIKITRNDVWLQVLPEFHIGAVSIFARAYLSGAKVIRSTMPLGQWSASDYLQRLHESGATLTSLVPTQLFDIVKKQLRPPEFLRAVFVGGSPLAGSLHAEAKNLGWPMIITYGMTEAASQVASSKIGDLNLKPLSHLKVQTDSENRIAISGSSLFTEYGYFDENGGIKFIDPKRNGVFVTEDLGKVTDGILQPLGRGQDYFKCGGEGVYLNKLREKLCEYQWRLGLNGQIELRGRSDERLGFVVEAVSAQNSEVTKKVVEEFNKDVMPFERIQKIEYVTELLRNELGKFVL